jgi:hypothetical protein
VKIKKMASITTPVKGDERESPVFVYSAARAWRRPTRARNLSRGLADVLR